MRKLVIKHRYQLLIKDVKTNKFYTDIDLKNRTNCYVCKCGHITKTIDIDPGVTPFSISCEKCDSQATSIFYKKDKENIKPTQEWFRPTLKELLKYKDKEEVEHVLKGGLVIRKIKN